MTNAVIELENKGGDDSSYWITDSLLCTETMNHSPDAAVSWVSGSKIIYLTVLYGHNASDAFWTRLGLIGELVFFH